MGYSNHWNIYGDWTPKEWELITEFYKHIKTMGSMYCPRIISDETKSHDMIRFNGADGVEEERHESFHIYKNGYSAAYDVFPGQQEEYKTKNGCTFRFCKTNRKDYDVAVWAMLSFMHTVNASKIEVSNGDGVTLERVPQ